MYRKIIGILVCILLFGASVSVGIGSNEKKSISSVSFTKHTIDSFFDGARCVFTCDVDGDTDIDVLGAASDRRQVRSRCAHSRSGSCDSMGWRLLARQPRRVL